MSEEPGGFKKRDPKEFSITLSLIVTMVPTLDPLELMELSLSCLSHLIGYRQPEEEVQREVMEAQPFCDKLIDWSNEQAEHGLTQGGNVVCIFGWLSSLYTSLLNEIREDEAREAEAAVDGC